MPRLWHGRRKGIESIIFSTVKYRCVHADDLTLFEDVLLHNSVLCLQFPGDSVITGRGHIYGRTVFVFSQVSETVTVLLVTVTFIGDIFTPRVNLIYAGWYYNINTHVW